MLLFARGDRLSRPVVLIACAKSRVEGSLSSLYRWSSLGGCNCWRRNTLAYSYRDPHSTKISSWPRSEARVLLQTKGVRIDSIFDRAYVTVALEPLLLRFDLVRLDFSVSVASSFAPQRWLDFQLVADGIARWSLTEPRPRAYSLADFASILRPRRRSIARSAVKQRFDAAVKKAIDLHNNAIDQYAAEAKKADSTDCLLRHHQDFLDGAPSKTGFSETTEA